MARFHGANSSSSAFASFRSRVSNPYVNFSQSTALRVVRLPSHRVLDNSNPALRTSTGSFAMLARDPPRFIAREQVSSRAPRQTCRSVPAETDPSASCKRYRFRRTHRRPFPFRVNSRALDISPRHDAKAVT